MPAGTRKRTFRNTKAPNIESPLPDCGPETIAEETPPLPLHTNRSNKLATKGRKAKVADKELPPSNNASNTVEDVLADPQSGTQGRKRTSRKRGHDDHELGTSTHPSKKSCKTQILPEHEVECPPKGRSPLPHRDGRNEHPGACITGKRRRTSEEVAAEKAAKEERKRQLLELEVKKRELLAQMDLEEEERELDLEIHAVRRLSDMRFIKPGSYESESEGEIFDMDVDTSEPEDVKMTKAHQKQKPTAVKTRKAAVKGEKANSSKAVVGEGKKATTRKGDKMVASGLIPNWEKHTKTIQNTLDKPGTGGLTDVDAQATKPDFRAFKRGQWSGSICFDNTRDISRTNTDVAPVSAEAEPKQNLNVHQNSTLKKSRAPKRCAPKCEQSQPNLPSQVVTQVVQPRTLTGNTVRIAHLPEFTQVDSKWRKVFVPSLYKAFFGSDAPFGDFVVGSTNFIRIVQGVVNCVYPEVDYTVMKDDAIHLLSYNRINEKRSSLGSDAMDSIRTYLKDTCIEDTMAWCRWAKRIDGPLFYSVPTPRTCPTNPNDEEYIKPDGRLKSPFIIQLAKKYLQLTKGAINKGGHPIGLFALILAALERAVRSYVKKAWTTPNDFSEKFFGDRVLDYVESCSKVKEKYWQDILDACSHTCTLDKDSSEDDTADISLLDRQRGSLFDFSSPIKT